MEIIYTGAVRNPNTLKPTRPLDMAANPGAATTSPPPALRVQRLAALTVAPDPSVTLPVSVDFGCG